MKLERALTDTVWSDKVKELWNERCAWAGCTDLFGLAPHHVFGRGNHRIRLIIENGISLCWKHHRRLTRASKKGKERLSKLLIGDKLYDELKRIADEE